MLLHEKQVQDEKFREDLYFRLNVFNLQVPGLRERPGDIRVLSEFFSGKYAEANGVPQRNITEEAMKKLEGHHWKGNVRELENTMHRAILLATGDNIDETAIILTGENLLRKNNEPGSPVPSLASATASASAPSPLVKNPEDTANQVALNNQGEMLGKTVAEVEQRLIIDTLQHCLGNRTHAATILGISIRTLRNKLKTYSDDGIQVPSSADLQKSPS